jgi:dUTP pyrophosphatase
MINVRRLSESARLPTKKTPGSVCMQLYSAHDVIVPSKGKVLVRTDLEVAVPEGTYGRIINKADLTIDNEVEIYASIIDGHCNNVGVVLYNHGLKDFVVSVGDCIAQLIIEQVVVAQVREGNSVY